jgi:hypothetical protein
LQDLGLCGRAETDLRGIGGETVGCIHMTEKRKQCSALVNMAMNFTVQSTIKNFLKY